MNKVELLGRLTKNIEVKYTKNNVMVTNFTLAVNRRYIKENEERQADFINIIAWNKLAEFCSKYFQRGQQIVVVGRIQSRTYEDSENKKHYVTEVVAEETYFADSKKNNNLNTDILNGTAGFETEEDELPF